MLRPTDRRTGHCHREDDYWSARTQHSITNTCNANSRQHWTKSHDNCFEAKGKYQINITKSRFFSWFFFNELHSTLYHQETMNLYQNVCINTRPGICLHSPSIHPYPLPHSVHAIPFLKGRSFVTLPSVCRVLCQSRNCSFMLALWKKSTNFANEKLYFLK